MEIKGKSWEEGTCNDDDDDGWKIKQEKKGEKETRRNKFENERKICGEVKGQKEDK